MDVDPVALGRRLVAEMRGHDTPESLPEDYPGAVWTRETADDWLGSGADDLDDETVWVAVMTAVELAADDDERWALGDTVVDESIAVRPALRARWHAASKTHEAVREVFRVMHDPQKNWGYDDGNECPAGWWSEGDWWAAEKARRSEGESA